jgi:hypothetical protein
MILVEITATGDLSTCDTYTVGHVIAPAKLKKPELVLSQLEKLNHAWIQVCDHDSQDEDFVDWLCEEHGFKRARRKDASVRYQLDRTIRDIVPGNALTLTEDAAERIAEILGSVFDREDVEVSPVFDSDSSYADDGGNVYVVELGNGVYLTYGKA